MRIVASLLMLLCVAAAPPAPAPGTQPLRPQEMEPLGDGTVRYLPPPQWNLVEKNFEALMVVFRSNDQRAQIAITVMPQTRAIQPAAKEQMALIIGKGIREAAAQGGNQLVIPPRVEADDRFFLKIRDAMTAGEVIADRVQMYRILGLNLVHVAATAHVENIEESKDVHELAERTLDSMRIGRGARRMVYPRAQLRVVVPLDWNEQKTDNPNGVVATYTDPKEPTRHIVITSRIIPRPAREDEEKRKALLEKMIDQERMKGAGPETEVPGTSYLRQIRTTLAADSESKRVDTRYLVVGDTLVSVRSIATADDADAVSEIADTLAAALKPVNEPKQN